MAKNRKPDRVVPRPAVAIHLPANKIFTQIIS